MTSTPRADTYLLVPLGARPIGLYDRQVADGQARVLVTLKRVILFRTA